MNVTLTSLEALILKATHESLPCPDAAALEAFCAVMREAGEGAQWAAQALAARLHSPCGREALLALSMLDRCMRRCDASFHAEVGKFRFLNEMIKLVSPKYFADRTAPEVQTRVLQLLHAWSIEYPKETKFKVAYDMLKNQGVVKETPPPLPPEDAQPTPRARAKSAIFEDEEKSKLLQKLLQSKKPEDLQHANRLIKTMVREEERRSSASSQRAAEVSAARDSAGLLRDMLAAARALPPSPDERQLMRELRAACAALRPPLHARAARPDQDGLADILSACDELDEVFEQYDEFENECKAKGAAESPPPEPPAASDSLLDFAGARADARSPGSSGDAAPPAVLDELGDIFSTASADTNIAEPLKPVSLMPSEDVDLLGNKKEKTEGWNELDTLSKRLLKESLPDNAKHMESFNSKPTKKIPMNELDKLSPKHDTQLSNNGALFDLDFFTSKPAAAAPPPPKDDLMVDISEGPGHNNNGACALDNILDLGVSLDNACDNTPVASKEDSINHQQLSEWIPPVLSDISVSLSSLRPAGAARGLLEDGGLRVAALPLGPRPRARVAVYVLTVTSELDVPIHDYNFQAVAPEDCRIRLLPASGSSLAARVSFLPAPALTQLLLAARAPGARLALSCAARYAAAGRLHALAGAVDDLPEPADE